MLSYERARYIREFILNCGVDPEQILLDNKVERVPSFTKNAESVRSMHRRVSLALQ
jgi:outer membrane protein OmpA-like peptidoglycan-associated protein